MASTFIMFRPQVVQLQLGVLSLGRLLPPRVSRLHHCGNSYYPTKSITTIHQRTISTTITHQQQSHTLTHAHTHTTQPTQTTSSPTRTVNTSDLPKQLLSSPLLTELYERGMIDQMTHIQPFIQHLHTPAPPSYVGPRTRDGCLPRVLYAGFDPTASSLHIGNLLVLMVLRRFQQWGHKTICVVGGATGMIGDPSGRSTERQMMNEEQLQRNIEGISKDIKKFLTFETPNSSTLASLGTSSNTPPLSPSSPSSVGLLLNNASWFNGIHIIPFFRDIGRHFRMGAMLNKDSVASRLTREGEGMSFTEFTYQVLQAYDFLHLHQQHQVDIQIGGSDQYGNITAGVDLIKRASTTDQQVFGLTLPLLTTSTGQKFGKSMGNAPIWLAAPEPASAIASAASPSNSSTTSSPYQLYQYFLSTSDADVIRYMKLFTDYSLAEIASFESTYGQGRQPQELVRLLAEAVTRLVHGEEGLKQALRSTNALFGSGNLAELTNYDQFMTVFGGVPKLELSKQDLIGSSLVDLAAKVGLAKSKGEIKRLIKNGGLYLNNQLVTNESHLIQPSDLILGERVCLLRSGKKKQFVILVV